MTYILAPNQIAEIFPYSIGDLRRDNPNVSFPRNPSDPLLASYNVFPVVPLAPPDYDPITQNLSQTTPTLVNGQWLQTWQVTDVSAEEIFERQRAAADYLAFWDALMVSTVYASIREQSFVSLPMNTLATEFIALIGDAKAGRPNEAAIQQSMDAILATGTFTDEQLVELQDALEAGHLESLYSVGGDSAGMVRARNADGTYMADDPATPDVNEAWVPAE